jgi:hypothetical protein
MPTRGSQAMQRVYRFVSLFVIFGFLLVLTIAVSYVNSSSPPTTQSKLTPTTTSMDPSIAGDPYVAGDSGSTWQALQPDLSYQDINSSGQIGSILLSAPDISSAWSVAEHPGFVGYSYDLTSNSDSTWFIPNKGQLSIGSNKYVSIMSNVNYNDLGPLTSFSVSHYQLGGIQATVTLPTKFIEDQSFAIKVNIRPILLQSNTSSNSPLDQEGMISNVTDGLILPIQHVFGSEYNTFIQAGLIETSFNVDPKEQDEQPLSITGNDFPFVLSPVKSGPQTIEIPIKAVLVPRKGGPLIKIPLVTAILTLNIEGKESSIPDDTSSSPPFFTLGQIAFSELVYIILPPLISINVVPYIAGVVKRRQNKKSARNNS